MDSSLADGTRFTLTSQGHTLGTFALEQKSEGRVCLRFEGAACMKSAGNGKVSFDGGGGLWAQYLISGDPASGISLLNCGFLEQKDRQMYIGLTADGSPCSNAAAPFLWQVQLLGMVDGHHSRPCVLTDGSSLILVSSRSASHLFGTFTVRHANKGCIGLQHAGTTLKLQGENNLRMIEGLQPHGPRAMFYCKRVGPQGSGVYTLQNELQGSFLASADGRLVVHNNGNESSAHFSFRVGADAQPLEGSPLGGPRRLEWDESFSLSATQKQHFVEQGFLKIDQCVPIDRVNAALRAINIALCCDGAVGVNPATGGTQYCAALGKTDAILDLMYTSPAWTAVQQLLGRGQAARVGNAQIALRPPQQGLDRHTMPEFTPASQWHIDGMGQGKHSPFSVLMGFTLIDVPENNMGNFTLFPGSHRVLQPLVKEQVEQKSGLFSNESAEGKPEIGLGHQITARAGDVVICHQKLAHRGGPNGSDGIRYQVYFRVSHVNHQDYLDSGAILEDLWLEFEGIGESLRH